MKHNKNIDVLRALALLQILLYHAWAVSGTPDFLPAVFAPGLQLSGEIGGTVFFALSGFGIYCSITSDYEKGTFRYKEYLAKRGRRILPPYYFCIIVSVLLVSGEYVSISGIKHVVLHLLCIHNLFPSAHGSINGALWTIGTIAQFYLIAPLLCKFFRKNGYITFLVTVVVTIAAKAGTYHFLYLSMETPGWYAFYAGRQLFTAIDNFAVGMFAAWLVQKRSPGLKPLRAWVLIVTALLIQLFLCSFGLSHGIHTNNLSGFMWHSLIALTIGAIMVGLACAPVLNTTRVLDCLAKNEYPIYLWHLLIYDNLLQRSEFIQKYATTGWGIIFLVLAAILMGVVMSAIVLKSNWVSPRKK